MIQVSFSWASGKKLQVPQEQWERIQKSEVGFETILIKVVLPCGFLIKWIIYLPGIWGVPLHCLSLRTIEAFCCVRWALPFFFGRWFAENEICKQSLKILSFIVNAVFKWIMLVPLWSFKKNMNSNVSLIQIFPDFFFLTFSLILWQTLPTFVFNLGPPALAGYVICKLKMLISFSLLLNSKAHSNSYFFFAFLCLLFP